MLRESEFPCRSNAMMLTAGCTSACRVWGLGFGVKGFGIGVSGLGSGLRVEKHESWVQRRRTKLVRGSESRSNEVLLNLHIRSGEHKFWHASYMGASLIRNHHPLGPTVGLCLGPNGDRRGWKFSYKRSSPAAFPQTLAGGSRASKEG